MKAWLTAFAMCQSMFCAIPCPWHGWDEKCRDKMLLCLPFLGLEIGLLWFGLGMLCRFFHLPVLMTGLVLSAFPYVATGDIHLDGFMDVTDAVRSYRSLERRREILKDSHVGSFAVIGVVLLMLAQFACMTTAADKDLRVLIFIPMLSRCGSMLSVLILPPMSTSQYVNREKKIGLPAALLALTLIAGTLVCGKSALALLGGAAGYLLALRKAYKSLEGMNGDIAGYALTCSELAAVAVLAIL